MLHNFSWLEAGVLAGMARPASTPNDLHELKLAGIDAIVSLTDMPILPSLLSEFGFAHRHLPVPDFAAPSHDQIEEFVAFVKEMRKESRAVVVHCSAGMGRTGTMLSSFLVSEGTPARDAIEAVRLLRPGSIETLEQEQAIYHYERTLRKTQRKKRLKKKRKRKKK